MKFVELKQKFILVLQLISQLENSSAFEYKKEAYNFENEKDLFRLKDKFIVPFLKCLPKALSDRKQRGQAKDICEENIRGLLVDTEIKDSLRALDVAHIALFEMMHQYLLGVESAEFSVLVQAIYDEIKLSKEDVGVLRCDALGHLNSHFKLDVLDSSKSDFSDELYRIGLSLNDCILELNEINCAKNNILKLKEDRDKTLQSQYAVLEEVAKLYIDGNGQEGLKRHDEAYFNKLFGSCLRFNGGNPEVMNKNDEFDFKGTLQTIILNCKRKRTLWARIWGKLQAGKTVALLLRKAQEVSSNTGLEVTSGDIRKREPVVAVWVDVNPTERAAKILRLELDYDNKHKHKENQLPGEIRKWKDRKAAAIDKFSEKVKSYGEALKKAFNFRQSFRALVQNAEKKGAVAGGLDSQVKGAEGGEKSQQETLLRLTGERKVDGVIILKYIEGNDQLLSLYNELKEREYLIKGNFLRVFSQFRTTMSGEAVKCSETWYTIEAAFTNRIRSNHQAMGGSEQDWTQLVANYPFLKNHGEVAAASDALMFGPVLSQSTEVSSEELSCMAMI